MEFQLLNLKNNQIKTIPLSLLNIEVDELDLVIAEAAHFHCEKGSFFSRRF